MEWVKAGDPRGAAVLYFGGGDNPGCANALVSHNDFGPSGHPGWPGDEDASWADGISFACTHSEVSDNTVTDATDGAIVIWGCSGSRFLRNHIKAVTRQAFGGINLVDYDGTDGNFRGVIVDANTIEALSAPIRVAIGMGPLIWFCADPNPSHRYNRGATITNNQLLGTHMGYGFAVAGVRDWVIRGNVDRSRHTGKPHQLCDQIPSIPTGFQQQSEYVESSKLQAEYVNGKLEGLIA
ncbi:MAG: hypothetical protein HYZ73_04825, partial [Elusimicrobia bacterium]|nr:hypothetical protein [Elusimicrobiota bacterium]